MKKKLNLQNLNLFSNDEMRVIKGGVSRDEYCNTLCMIIVNGCYSPACTSAWGMNCAQYGLHCY